MGGWVKGRLLGGSWDLVATVINKVTILLVCTYDFTNGT